MGNGEWGMGSGEWGMGNGEWVVGNGEWNPCSKESFFRMLILPGLDSVARKFWARFVKAIIRKIFIS
jgi:hypothetical protein